EGKTKPVMPPKGKPQPTAAEKKLLRDWVAAGAKDDSAVTKVTLPNVKPKMAQPAPVRGLVYVPNTDLLLAGAEREVYMIDGGRGVIARRLAQLSGAVTAAAVGWHGGVKSPQTLRLAVASGTAGTAGEVRIYAAAQPGDMPKVTQVIAAHADLIYDVA